MSTIKLLILCHVQLEIFKNVLCVTGKKLPKKTQNGHISKSALQFSKKLKSFVISMRHDFFIQTKEQE